jgi:hypothetical protein
MPWNAESEVWLKKKQLWPREIRSGFRIERRKSQ